MGIRVIHVMTHDSIGLGEDGPTHQPVAHLASLRAMPNLLVFRPADAAETAEAWACALAAARTPSVLCLTPQGVAPLPRTAGPRRAGPPADDRQGNVGPGGYGVRATEGGRGETL